MVNNNVLKDIKVLAALTGTTTRSLKQSPGSIKS